MNKSKESPRDPSEKVYFQIQPSAPPTVYLLDVNQLTKKMQKEIIEILDFYGIESEETLVGGKGAGGLVELLKFLWENREYIKIAIKVIVSLNDLIKIPAEKVASKSISRNKPRFILWLSLKDDGAYLEALPPEGVDRKLINLKFFADEICKILEEKFPFFIFDQYLEQTVTSMGFSANYTISYESRGDWSLARFIGEAKSLRVRNGLNQAFTFYNSPIVIRNDHQTVFKNDVEPDKTRNWKKTYYLAGSSKVIADYIYRSKPVDMDKLQTAALRASSD